MQKINRWWRAQKCEAGFYLGSQRLVPLNGRVNHCTSGTLLEIGGREYAEATTARLKVVLDPMPWGTGDYVQGVGERIPIKTGSISECYIMNTLDHCADPLRVVQEIKRVLAPLGGHLVISCNVFPLWLKPLFPLLNRFDGPHPWHFTKSSLIALLHSGGFEITEMKSWKPQVRQRHFLSSVKVLSGRILGLTHVCLECSP